MTSPTGPSVEHRSDPPPRRSKRAPAATLAAEPGIPQEVDDAISFFAVAAGPANVIMQLSHLPIGRGVAESKVESGRVDRHPVKRLRTTFGYTMIAMFGTEAERDAMRSEVNRSHKPVRSDASSPVAYNAFDRNLQLWVAACLYWGMDDIYVKLCGEPTEEQRDTLYRHAARFGTTLQVPEEMWPRDRAAFQTYWNEGLARVEMDDLTRDYLRRLIRLRFLSLPTRTVLGPVLEFLTMGFLPDTFREEIGLPWDARRQAVFDAYLKATAVIHRLLPRLLRQFPWNFFLWDARRRLKNGQPFV